MKEDREFELLSDLARLIKKYGPETFEGLAHDLANPSFVEKFTEVLNKMAKVAHNTRRTAKKQPSGNLQRQDFRLSLVSIGLNETEKGALLMNLYDGLRSKALLPTLKEMQNFALDNGLPSLRANSREKAIIPFVKAFIPMSVQNARECIMRIQPIASHDRKLDGWSDIIFGKKNEVSNIE